jgi:sugar/nucleoside kinase (ribokinase family)
LIRSGLLAVGHVLLDYVGDISGEIATMLDTLSTPAHVGAAEMADIAAAIDRHQGSGGRWRAGGGAALTAMAWTRMGSTAVLAGCVGRDEGGILFRQKSGGIELCLAESDKPTGRFCRFLVPEGEKIVASPSAARDIRGFAIPDRYFRSGWVLHVDGLLIDDQAWLGRIANRAREAGMMVSIDISTSSNAAHKGKELTEFAREHCDLVFANEKEWNILKECKPAPDFSGSTTTWVVKMGEKGSSALERGDWISRPVARILEPEDDIGAGDAFAAGFLAARLKGGSTARCLDMGNENAALLLSGRMRSQAKAR